jgi:hypothetical protein
MTTGNPNRLAPRGDSPAPSSHEARASEPAGGDLGDAFVDEAVNAVAVVFASVEPTRDDLITHALRNRTRPPIIAALQALPNRRYRNVRQVRNDLLRQQR